MSAPYSGGNSPGGQLFFVDGDFTQADPVGMPVLSFPFKGDSVLSTSDIAFFYPTVPTYLLVQLGTYPNIQPWSPNQNTVVLEQDFIVAQSSYQPMPLNTPYNIAWSLGFQQTFSGNNNYPWGGSNLNQNGGVLYLVEEGPLEDIGGGLSKFKRKFATIPPTRNETEQFGVTFPSLSTDNSFQRPGFTQNVQTRIQYDYFIFDDLDILTTQLFTQGGNRLDKTTGLYPNGLILPATWFFSNSQNVQTNHGFYVGNTVMALSDGDPSDPTTATLPSATEYISWATGVGTSNNQPAEIIVEASTLTRWMGNIFERKTRFTQAI
jgi:hypothetical protein